MKIMNIQIIGDHYNPPLLWQYERIDEISSSLKMSIDTPIHREILAIYLEYIYQPFNDYLIEKIPDSFTRYRNSRYTSDLEYHALHEYLKINSFTKEYVNKYIEIDDNDRLFFSKQRSLAANRYFDKYSTSKLNIYYYDSNKFDKYKYSYDEIDIDQEYINELKKVTPEIKKYIYI